MRKSNMLALAAIAALSMVTIISAAPAAAHDLAMVTNDTGGAPAKMLMAMTATTGPDLSLVNPQAAPDPMMVPARADAATVTKAGCAATTQLDTAASAAADTRTASSS